jgi:hypothetical protein
MKFKFSDDFELFKSHSSSTSKVAFGSFYSYNLVGSDDFIKFFVL